MCFKDIEKDTGYIAPLHTPIKHPEQIKVDPWDDRNIAVIQSMSKELILLNKHSGRLYALDLVREGQEANDRGRGRSRRRGYQSVHTFGFISKKYLYAVFDRFLRVFELKKHPDGAVVGNGFLKDSFKLISKGEQVPKHWRSDFCRKSGILILMQFQDYYLRYFNIWVLRFDPRRARFRLVFKRDRFILRRYLEVMDWISELNLKIVRSFANFVVFCVRSNRVNSSKHKDMASLMICYDMRKRRILAVRERYLKDLACSPALNSLVDSSIYTLHKSRLEIVKINY